MEYQDLNLTNIANGAAEELFQAELQNVLRNVDDVNTPHAAVRKITIELKFKSNADRDFSEVEVSCKSALAPIKGAAGSLYINKERGKFTAMTKHEEQAELLSIKGSK